MTAILDATLVEIAARIAAGDCTSVEVTDYALIQARALQSRLNCFVRLEEDSALAQARAAALTPFHPSAHQPGEWGRRGGRAHIPELLATNLIGPQKVKFSALLNPVAHTNTAFSGLITTSL